MKHLFGLFLILSCSKLVWSMDTELLLYRPFTETTKHPVPKIQDEKNGECLQQSSHIKREDAWQCISDNKTYDPCFLPPLNDENTLLCVESPWSRTAIQLHVKAPLDSSQLDKMDMSRTFPWSVELARGVKCVSTLSQEESSIDNLLVRYHCNDGSTLVGDIQHCSPEWKMLQQRSFEPLTTVILLKAWF